MLCEANGTLGRSRLMICGLVFCNILCFVLFGLFTLSVLWCCMSRFTFWDHASWICWSRAGKCEVIKKIFETCHKNLNFWPLYFAGNLYFSSHILIWSFLLAVLISHFLGYASSSLSRAYANYEGDVGSNLAQVICQMSFLLSLTMFPVNLLSVSTIK